HSPHYRLTSWVVERSQNAQFREALLGLSELGYRSLTRQSLRSQSVRKAIARLKAQYPPVLPVAALPSPAEKPNPAPPDRPPYAMVARAVWGKLMLECLSGGTHLIAMLEDLEVKMLIQTYPDLEGLIKSADLSALEEFLAFTVAPEQETLILFINPAM